MTPDEQWHAEAMRRADDHARHWAGVDETKARDALATHLRSRPDDAAIALDPNHPATEPWREKLVQALAELMRHKLLLKEVRLCLTRIHDGALIDRIDALLADKEQKP